MKLKISKEFKYKKDCCIYSLGSEIGKHNIAKVTMNNEMIDLSSLELWDHFASMTAPKLAAFVNVNRSKKWEEPDFDEHCLITQSQWTKCKSKLKNENSVVEKIRIHT